MLMDVRGMMLMDGRGGGGCWWMVGGCVKKYLTCAGEIVWFRKNVCVCVCLCVCVCVCVF